MNAAWQRWPRYPILEGKASRGEALGIDEIPTPGKPPPSREESDRPGWFADLMSILLDASGIHFECFKDSAVAQVLRQQMAMARVSDVRAYLGRLRRDIREAERFAAQLLNRTTRFFRDPAVFAALKVEVLRPLARCRRPIRVWVPGCSTGQEAYSIGMTLLECFLDSGLAPPCAIAATDVSPWVLGVAREGIYPERAMEGVSPERRARFFTRIDGQFQVVPELRALCDFSRHDLLFHSPPARMDVVSCRNVLIYYNSSARARMLEAFHQALKPGGHLLLGRSETTDGASGLFETVNRPYRIYRKP